MRTCKEHHFYVNKRMMPSSKPLLSMDRKRSHGGHHCWLIGHPLVIVTILALIVTVNGQDSSDWFSSESFVDSIPVHELAAVRTMDLYSPLIRPDQSLRTKNGTLLIKKYDEKFLNAIARNDLESLTSYAPSNTDNCFRDLLNIAKDVISVVTSKGQMPFYLIPMVDSIGKLPSGITSGAVVWPGYFRQCVEPTDIFSLISNGSMQRKSMDGRYCSITLTMELSNATPAIPFIEGVCIPSACQGKDLTYHSMFLVDMMKKLIPGLSQVGDFMKLHSVYCHPRPEEVSLDGPAIGVIALLLTLFSFVIIGTIVEVSVARCQRINEYKILQEDESPNTSSDSGPFNRGPVNTNHPNIVGASGSSTSDDGNDEVPSDERKKFEDENEGKHIREESPENNNSVSVDVEGEEVIIPSKIRLDETSAWKKFFIKFFSSFSFLSNLRRLLTVNDPTGEDITCIHGIRFWSMAWVMLCHIYAFSIAMVNNPLDLVWDFGTAPYYWILNGSFNVDSFFLLSGLLMSYHFFKESTRKADETDLRVGIPLQERVKSIKFWFVYIIHRVWRLVPTYALIMYLDACLAHYASSGPFWDYGDSETSEKKMCAAEWWKNLLFVNNFTQLTSQCMAWTWYLANDMQFYVIAPVFLLFLMKSRKLGYSILFCTLVGFTALTWGISYRYDIIIGFPQIAKARGIDGFMNYSDKLYTKPWTRISPYLVGLVLGLFLREGIIVKKLAQVNFWRRMVLWSVSLVILGATLYGPYHANLNSMSQAFYNALSRTSWALGLGLLILMASSSNIRPGKKEQPLIQDSSSFGSITSALNVIDGFLSWSLFVPLSRLTYCAYLVHPIVMMYVYRSIEQGIRYTSLVMAGYFVSALTIVYIVSGVIHLLIEAPFIRLELAFFRKRKVAK